MNLKYIYPKEINFEKATPWPASSPGGDTVWLGATDTYGNTVSLQAHVRLFPVILLAVYGIPLYWTTLLQIQTD